MIAPVIQRALSEATKTITSATSSGWPIRLSASIESVALSSLSKNSEAWQRADRLNFCQRSVSSRVRYTRRSRQCAASPCCFPRGAAPFAMTRAECDALSWARAFRRLSASSTSHRSSTQSDSSECGFPDSHPVCQRAPRAREC